MCETRPREGRGSPQSRQFAGWGISKGEPASGWCRRTTPAAITPKGDLRDAPTRESGEGGIRTLEAGISPPNALAGRRLQPLGHFSGGGIVPAPFPTRKPATAGFRRGGGRGI